MLSLARKQVVASISATIAKNGKRGFTGKKQPASIGLIPVKRHFDTPFSSPIMNHIKLSKTKFKTAEARMKIVKWMPVALLLSISLPAAHAEDIYTWREGGVQRFSNRKPPVQVQKYEIIPGVPETPPQEQGEAFQAGDDGPNERLVQQQIKARTVKEQQTEAARLARNERGKHHLRRQIDALKRRSLSPTFTEGMRKERIRALQEKIEDLEYITYPLE